jgi:nucleotide-binding universal stress UspA family protein
VHAEYSVIEAGVDIHDQAVIADTLAARAKALDASYLVMGGYSHSRVGEYIFGGVTRTMLSQAPVPLLIAR